MFSVQECLNSAIVPGIQTVPNPQQTLAPSLCCGKLIDNPSSMPIFTIEKVLDYLVYRKEEDNMRAEDWKSFKSGGFKLFKEGHVHNIMVHRQGIIFGVNCRCLPEMKKDRVYKINVEISTETSSVHLAECSCPAGKGPHGSCKHIAATLFALENFYTIFHCQEAEGESLSCTSKLQMWNQPRKKRLDSKPASDISFKVEEYNYKPCRHPKEFMDPRPVELQQTTDGEKTEFTKALKQLGVSCGFLDLMVPQDDAPSKLPMTPRSAQCRVKAQIIKECMLPPTLETITSYADSFLKMIRPSDEQRKAVERKTRRQGSCLRWREERHLRLTASNFGKVVLRKSNFPKLAEEITFSSIPDTIPSIRWGRMHENDAFAQYLENHTSNNLRKAGFYIGEQSYLGASPDGVLEMSEGLKVLEIKCPYSVKDITVEEACTKREFYCTLEDGQLCLNQTHAYYYQVQGTMAITGARECDFVVWTPKSMKVQTIFYDAFLWENTMFPQLQNFYHQYMLPFILY